MVLADLLGCHCSRVGRRIWLGRRWNKVRGLKRYLKGRMDRTLGWEQGGLCSTPSFATYWLWDRGHVAYLLWTPVSSLENEPIGLGDLDILCGSSWLTGRVSVLGSFLSPVLRPLIHHSLPDALSSLVLFLETSQKVHQLHEERATLPWSYTALHTVLKHLDSVSY